MTARLLRLAAMAAFIGGPAAAQDDGRGFYLDAFGGLSQLLGDDATFLGREGGASNVSYDAGYALGGAVGFAYSRNLAAEVEFAYRTGDAKDLSRGLGTDGDYASTSVLANGIWTFDEVADGVRPYLGAGLGAVTEIDFDVKGGTAADEYNDRWRFAFQGFAGLAYDLNDDWRVTGEVRYFDAGTPTLSGGGRRLEARYNTVDVLLGVAYRF